MHTHKRLTTRFSMRTNTKMKILNSGLISHFGKILISQFRSLIEYKRQNFVFCLLISFSLLFRRTSIYSLIFTKQHNEFRCERRTFNESERSTNFRCFFFLAFVCALQREKIYSKSHVVRRIHEMRAEQKTHTRLFNLAAVSRLKRAFEDVDGDSGSRSQLRYFSHRRREFVYMRWRERERVRSTRVHERNRVVCFAGWRRAMECNARVFRAQYFLRLSSASLIIVCCCELTVAAHTCQNPLSALFTLEWQSVYKLRQRCGNTPFTYGAYGKCILFPRSGDGQYFFSILWLTYEWIADKWFANISIVVVSGICIMISIRQWNDRNESIG